MIEAGKRYFSIFYYCLGFGGMEIGGFEKWVEIGEDLDFWDEGNWGWWGNWWLGF